MVRKLAPAERGLVRTGSGGPAEAAGGCTRYAALSNVRRQRLQMYNLRTRPSTSILRRWTLGRNCRFVARLE